MLFLSIASLPHILCNVLGKGQAYSDLKNLLRSKGRTKHTQKKLTNNNYKNETQSSCFSKNDCTVPWPVFKLGSESQIRVKVFRKNISATYLHASWKYDIRIQTIFLPTNYPLPFISVTTFYLLFKTSFIAKL